MTAPMYMGVDFGVRGGEYTAVLFQRSGRNVAFCYLLYETKENTPSPDDRKSGSWTISTSATRSDF